MTADPSSISSPQAIIIDGKARAQQLRQELAQQVKALQEQTGITPGLAVILVGEDPASQVYVRNKGKQTREVGMHSEECRLPEHTSQEELIARIEQYNNDPNIHGILVQLPLPDHIDEAAVIHAIAPEKDVDGFHIINSGLLATGQPAIIPCTPRGSMILLQETLGDLSGLHALVVGRSNIVGKPVAALLLQANCTVTTAHSHTKNLPELCKQADILVAAVGKPGYIQASWLKPGVTIIDVGINRVTNPETGGYRLVGDVAFDEACHIAHAITPVPGGVGPMTIACLLQNTLDCARKQVT